MTQALRILQVAQKPQRRGAEIFAVQLAAALRQLGHDARTLFLYRHGGPGLELGSDDECLEGREDSFIERAGSVNPLLLSHLKRRFEIFQPHIVQLNGARSLKYGAYVHLMSGRRPWLNVYRNIDDPRFWQRDPIRRSFYRHFVIPRMDGIIAVSARTLEGVNDLYRPRVPTTVIRNGVETAHALAGLGEPPPSGSRRKETRGLLLFVGALTPQKRPDRFIRVVEGVQNRLANIEGWIVGEGPLEANLRRQIHARGLRSIVRLCGSQQRLGPYFAEADLLLVTSDSDGIPAVVLEAGLARLPTVATDVGGMKECVIPHVTGLLLPRDEEDLFIEATAGLLASPADRETMGLEARNFSEREFSMPSVSRRYAAFYRDLRERFPDEANVMTQD